MSRKPPYTKLDPAFLEPRDPILGYIKIGGKEERHRRSRAGKPWVAPTRFLDPPRFEVTTREKRVERIKGTGKLKGETFTVDFGFHRDEKFHANPKVGESPSSLRIRLMYPTADENMLTYLGAHSGSRWECRGNGVEAKDMKRGDCPCPCPRLAQFEGAYKGTLPQDGTQAKPYLYPCKPHGQLMCLLDDAEVFGGFWPFKTTGYESISNIMKTLERMEEIFKRIDGLPFELRVQAATKSFKGEDAEGKTTQPIVTVVLAASMDAARQIASDAAQESRKYLAAPSDDEAEAYRKRALQEMEEEGEGYAGEFSPEVIDPDGPIQGGKVESEAAPDPEGEEPPPFEVVDEDDDEEEEETEAEVIPPGLVEAPEPEEEEEGPTEEEIAADAALEETCRAVLKEIPDFDQKMINERIEYHRRKDGHMRTLADRLRTNMADAWETATGESAEPGDGLAE